MTVRLTGYASTSAIDDEHCSFAPGSIVVKSMPPLYISHRCDVAPCGTVVSLKWEGDKLLAVVDVPDELGDKYKAFSIGCKLREYEIIGLGPSAYGLVTRAIANELSLTNNPANPEALILTRERVVIKKPSWEEEWAEFMKGREQRLKKALEEMRRGA